jgi:membrane dipeptidase
MTDEMIRALAQRGGVIQINFYPVFLDSRFAEILAESGIQERGERVEAEFIAEPSDDARRRAWNDVQKELMALDRPSYKLIADHIDHVVELVGIDHVGLGSDFDGIDVTPEGMEDVSMLPKLFEELRARGYAEDDLIKIAGGNFLRVLDEVSVS